MKNKVVGGGEKGRRDRERERNKRVQRERKRKKEGRERKTGKKINRSGSLRGSDPDFV